MLLPIAFFGIIAALLGSLALADRRHQDPEVRAARRHLEQAGVEPHGRAIAILIEGGSLGDVIAAQ